MRIPFLFFAAFLLMQVASARFVEFAFELPAAPGNPFQRDIRAAVVVPDRGELWYPAFYDGDSIWRVRVRDEGPGAYRLEGIAEWTESEPRILDSRIQGHREVAIPAGNRMMPAVGIDPDNPTLLRCDDGSPYLPLGMNISWGWGDFFETTFPSLKEAGLNWGRIWMTHWNGTNLDWKEGKAGPSPAPGSLDLGVARKWDRIIEWAETNEVWIQLVLQHHGQFSTKVDPNWAGNPWNVVNGGFLEDPADFFTSEEAKRLTRWKYRTIVARYGHSPAILAWELFNEVFGTDALRLNHDEASVAAWHDEMAAWIRSIDPYGHLVTTSHDDLASPIYASMDYYQPHLYGLNMLAHVRRFPGAPEPLDKPLFYGEVGDSSMLFPEPEDQSSGVGLIPHLWAGLMAQDALPAQAWYWDRLLGTPQMAELSSLAAFVKAADLASSWGELRAFTPEVETDVTVPQVITAGMNWGPRPVLDWNVDRSGQEDAALADVPYYMVGNPTLIEQGFPDRLILRMNGPDPRTLRVKLDDVGADGVTLRIRIDGEVVKDLNWPSITKTAESALRPAQFEIDVEQGGRVFSMENLGPDTIRLREINMDVSIPALAAAGKRSPDLMVLYLWHRTQVHSAVRRDPASGFILIDGVSAGDWRVAWWNMEGGVSLKEEGLCHPGGLLRLSTPDVTRHAAVILKKGALP